MKSRNLIWSFPTLLAGLVIFLNSSCNTAPATVTDIDGNVYKSVKIGTQVWMASNLKTTRFDDGNAIPLVSEKSSWSAVSTPEYCWYNNEVANKEVYGALYNWSTVSTGRLCPSGWHIPTDAEWGKLMTYLGGDSIASGKLQEKGMTHWQSPNSEGTNISGFTALPGGFRSYYGDFCSICGCGCLWSSTEDGTYYAWGRLVGYGFNPVDRVTYVTQSGWSVRNKGGNNKQSGFSVRCLRD